MRIKSKSDFLHSIVGSVNKESSDESLVAQVAQSDSLALEILYDRYASTVLGISLKISGDQLVAEEVLQETFWRVWRHAATYQPQLGSFTVWLFRIARNLVVDLHRRQNSRVQTLGYGDHDALDIDQTPDPNADVAEQVQTSFKQRQIRIALAKLPEEQRQVIEMAYFFGMTRQEIAEATGEALGTIHTRARLGLQKLRRELEKQNFER